MSEIDRSLTLIAAMEVEIVPLLRHLKRISSQSPRQYQGKLRNWNVHIFISGIGFQAAARTTRFVLKNQPRLVLSLGFAGGLSKLLKSGDILMPQTIRNIYGDSMPGNVVRSNFSKGHTQGTLLTVDFIVPSPEEKASLSMLADAVDMETFAVASHCQKQGVPFASIRAIMDDANERLPLDFSSTLNNGEVSTIKVMRELFRHPSKIFPVMQLGRRSQRLAKLLTDFALDFLTDFDA